MERRTDCACLNALFENKPIEFVFTLASGQKIKGIGTGEMFAELWKILSPISAEFHPVVNK